MSSSPISPRDVSGGSPVEGQSANSSPLPTSISPGVPSPVTAAAARTLTGDVFTQPRAFHFVGVESEAGENSLRIQSENSTLRLVSSSSTTPSISSATSPSSSSSTSPIEVVTTALATSSSRIPAFSFTVQVQPPLNHPAIQLVSQNNIVRMATMPALPSSLVQPQGPAAAAIAPTIPRAFSAPEAAHTTADTAVARAAAQLEEGLNKIVHGSNLQPIILELERLRPQIRNVRFENAIQILRGLAILEHVSPNLRQEDMENLSAYVHRLTRLAIHRREGQGTIVPSYSSPEALHTTMQTYSNMIRDIFNTINESSDPVFREQEKLKFFQYAFNLSGCLEARLEDISIYKSNMNNPLENLIYECKEIQETIAGGPIDRTLLMSELKRKNIFTRFFPNDEAFLSSSLLAELEHRGYIIALVASPSHRINDAFGDFIGGGSENARQQVINYLRAYPQLLTTEQRAIIQKERNQMTRNEKNSIDAVINTYFQGRAAFRDYLLAENLLSPAEKANIDALLTQYLIEYPEARPYVGT